MEIKIDLKKAYDRLNLDFVRDTLEVIGLLNAFVNLVWACITSSSMQMLWNGDMSEEFKPTRGIRQGEHVSLYRFILCMGHLSHIIDIVVENNMKSDSNRKKWSSHLAFIDDLILFSKASLEQVEVIYTCLELFYNSSNRKVSQEKTRIYFL